MGSGFRTQQARERFHLGQEVESEPHADCAETTPERYKIGEYTILRDEEGFRVNKGDQEIGSFSEGKVLVDETRALFKLEKGMLFEVRPEGHRQIFSKEKAGLHGAACADGSLRCGGYWQKYRGKWGWHYMYDIRLSEPDPAVRAIFGRNVEIVYGIKAHDYPKRKEIYGCGKEMAYDLAKYGPINRYSWRVPFEHLDREGARYWLRSFFTGDGTSHVGKRRSDDDVRASSVNKAGLEEVRSLLEDRFGIRSYLYYGGHKKNEATKNWSELFVLETTREGLEKFRDEIGFDSPEKQRKLNYMVKRLRGE